MVTTLRRRWAVVLLAALAVVGGMLAWQASPASAATCTTSSPTGGCGPYNDPTVFNSSNGADLVVQNDFSSIPQTLNATDSTTWTVAGNTAGFADQTSVKSYPATQVTYTLPNGLPDPSSDFGTTLTSAFTNTIPSGSGQDYEYAVDDWLANPSQPSWTNDFELMIWTYTNGQVPAGNDTGKVLTDSAGTQWEVWVAGGATTVSPDSTVSFVRKTNAVSGSLDRWDFYNYLIAQGMLHATFGIDQTNYGLEICSTGGSAKTYGVTGYSLVVNGSGPTPTPTPTATTPTPTPTTPTPTPTPTTTSTGPTQLVLGLSWLSIANTNHYVVQWTPTGGSTVVFRPTVPSLSATVNGTSGKLTIDAIVASGAARHISTSSIAAQ